MQPKKIETVMQSAGYHPKTSSDEEYILSKDEEAAVLKNAVEEARKNMLWRLKDKGLPEDQINSQMSKTDFLKSINASRILHVANSAKLQEIWHREQRIKEREKAIKDQEEKKQRCTAEYMFKLMAANCRIQTGTKLIVNGQTESLIKALCFFFSDDRRFETDFPGEDYRLSKGLMIRGSCGLGKTFLVELLKDNELKPVHIVSMKQINDTVMKEGGYVPPVSAHLYIDDVGVEAPEVFFYKTKVTWFKSFIEDYYIKKLPFNRLMVSTMYSAEDLENKYGAHIRSRMRQMFNVIDVEGEDLRK